MPELIDWIPSKLKPTDVALTLQRSQSRVDAIFRELAIRDTTGIGDSVAGMLASKLEEVGRLHPELTGAETYILAARLLKQIIACYQSELNQLLP
jgi:pyridoxal/pyridoxine/pyridoxamine kinase